ncbi:MAG TPA: hypoxanthine phosphoribosyltransferase [Acidobacteriota bacterium]|nr:hypoxanthine phosphoribosyltransferase [Acidobacteriota bacterium]HRR56773.1 hypoxanthine phosphoribosyltransferase [Acidobacteriota bacterium]HRV08439.1 hypoxanthine phosphoribosyltransferase [Acidobacteriota bacterium]
MRDSRSAELSPQVGTVVLTEQEIQRRVAGLADEISQDYEGREILAVAVLKGALPFAVDLVRRLSVPAELEMLGISRYQSSGREKTVRIVRDLEEQPTGRDVLIVEDIVDTGLTLHYLTAVLRRRAPASIRTVTLLDRPELRLADIRPDYVGFSVSEAFLVGYGLDYRERFRGLPYIAELIL